MQYLIILILILFAPLCWAETVIVDETCNNKYGAKLVSLQGKLLYDSDRKGHWRPAQINQLICEGSGVMLEPYSRASLRLSNGLFISLGAGSIAKLDFIAPDKPTFLTLIKGFVHIISRTPKPLKISTPIANAGPEGTEFAMSVDDTNASLWVYEGGVKFFNDKGSVHLSPGQAAQAQLGQAPKTTIDIKPQDAVNWALYYPPVLPYPDKTTVIDSSIRKAIQDFRQGHVDIALTQLDAFSVGQQTPYYHKVRGAMRLTAGQDKLALQDIQALLANNPNDAEALALQSVMALTQNRKDEAYSLATKATAANPKSASAYSALSYAEQGRFNLEKAQIAADQAAKLAPHDAMVWARKAELELSQGLTSESRAAAEKATALDAGLERTQTVLGFSYLLRMETDEALETFTKAIQFDSTSPLARLGLGLAKIRNGDLEEGRQDLETAAILDPNNSIVRSYLGKAYYEERRSSLAEDQFSLAKERDPKDPTPFFYDAINKQTTNRPVEALHDMQNAIELNGNRGIYRSKLMLESDEAARNASLGRIYNDLGFQHRGLLEGWKSVNQDPSNYSAHRLLADNYAVLPRHEISRLSELLKAQLLQPLNITPVQPQSSESNILILDGLGSSITSFNEYNPLFTRNRFALQATGFYGSNNTISDEAVHSGIWNKLSYSIGQFHYQTDGYRQNNKQQKDVFNFFSQAEITKDANIQIELKRSEQDFGDINQRFFKTFSLLNHAKKNNNFLRGGLHYKFSEKSDLLMSLVHAEQNYTGVDDTQGFIANFSHKTYGTQYELQHMYRDQDYDLTLGMNYLINQEDKIEDVLKFPPPLGDQPLNLNSKSNHKSFYAYLSAKVTPKLQITAGLTQDFYQRDLSIALNQTQLDLNPTNPKFGLIWTPTNLTTFRFSALRSLNRGITQKQTLEPTQLAGFNQFYDDMEGSIMDRIGIGLDHKFTSNLFVGAEISKRHINIPFVNTLGNIDSTKWNENNARSYINWTPNDQFSIGVAYNYEKLIRNSEAIDIINTNFFTQLETHRTQLFGNFYHSSGFMSKLNLEYVSQDGNFLSPIGNPPKTDSSQFYLLDAQIGYRFPKRHGQLLFGVKNLLNNHFNFQGTDLNYPELPQARFIFGRLTFSF